MTAEHWDSRYSQIGDTEVSWFQAEPRTSLDLIGEVSGPQDSVVDVGGGASRLVDHLLERGYHDITVVDLSQHAMSVSRDRVGNAPVHWVVSDVREWVPDRTFHVWHDRAVYHFLVDPEDQQRYWDLVRASVPIGRHVVIATFADNGPEMCSGLPVQRYSEGSLAVAMGEGFTVLRTLREQHVTPSGGGQAFLWLIAQRT